MLCTLPACRVGHMAYSSYAGLRQHQARGATSLNNLRRLQIHQNGGTSLWTGAKQCTEALHRDLSRSALPESASLKAKLKDVGRRDADEYHGD